jgi:uroporphyrinogen decarboxylase
MLAIGAVSEVEEYCKRLIDGIGYDGGFVLSSGCVVPVECKLENFRAMIDTAKTYELSR